MWVEGTHWQPSPASEKGTVAVCNVSTCRYTVSTNDEASVFPSFSQKRIIVWYQTNCMACKTNEPVFNALVRAGQTSAERFTVHKVEATSEQLKKFPHVTVVPLYDIVTPTAGSTSPYGPGTALKTVRNDVAQLKQEITNLVV